MDMRGDSVLSIGYRSPGTRSCKCLSPSTTDVVSLPLPTSDDARVPQSHANCTHHFRFLETSAYMHRGFRMSCTLRADDRVEREFVSNSEVTAVARSVTVKRAAMTSTGPKARGVSPQLMHDKGL